MPYIIAVLALVIVGTGYTLFQREAVSTTEPSTVPLVATETRTLIPDSPLTDTTDNSQTTASMQEEDDTNTGKPLTTSPKPVTAVPGPPASTPTPAPADNNTYTNGTYYAAKSYRTPDGTYQMDVSMTIKDDKVTASTLSFDADGSRDSYSKRFSSGYQNQVIGQTLEGFSLSRVGGASLTTNAFNSAVSSIRSQAS